MVSLVRHHLKKGQTVGFISCRVMSCHVLLGSTMVFYFSKITTSLPARHRSKSPTEGAAVAGGEVRVEDSACHSPCSGSSVVIQVEMEIISLDHMSV